MNGLSKLCYSNYIFNIPFPNTQSIYLKNVHTYTSLADGYSGKCLQIDFPQTFANLTGACFCKYCNLSGNCGSKSIFYESA